MKTSSLSAIITLISFLLSSSYGSAYLTTDKVFGSLAKKLVATPELQTNLLQKVSLREREGVSVVSVKGVNHVLFIEKFPKVLSIGEKKEFIEIQGVNALVKFQALNVDGVREKLTAFTHEDVIIEYAGCRLFSNVEGKVSIRGVTMQFASVGDYVGVYIEAPEKAVSIRAVELVSSKQAKQYYIVALLSKVKSSMKKKMYEDAVKLLFEAKQHGYRTKELYIQLFLCYAHGGDKRSLTKVSDYLLASKAMEVTMDDCIELARAAKEKGFSVLAQLWFTEAESRVSKGLNLEMLLQENK